MPHSVAVNIDRWEEAPRITRIYATIRVEREGQKGIVIGRKGERLKAIGTRARKDIEHLLGSKVFLDLNVRVTEGWTTAAPSLEMLGYGRSAPRRGAQ